MSYEAFARSNYFRVKDTAVFLAAVDGISGIAGAEGKEVAGTVVVWATTPDGWPTWSDEADDDWDVADFVAGHLADDEVAVFMSVEHDRLNFIGGTACAINSRGERARVALDDIYVAAAGLGANMTRVDR